jgi:hypothetical protein
MSFTRINQKTNLGWDHPFGNTKVDTLEQVKCFLISGIPSRLEVTKRNRARDIHNFGLEGHDHRIRLSDDRAVEVLEHWRAGSDKRRSGKDSGYKDRPDLCCQGYKATSKELVVERGISRPE